MRCKENVVMKTRCTGPSEIRQGDFRCSQSLIFSSLPLLATLTKVISASFVPRWGLKQGRKKIMQFKVWGRRQPHDRSFKTVRDTEAEAVADTETEKVSRKGGCNDFGRKEHFHSNEKPLLGGAINFIWRGWQAKIQVKIREKRRSVWMRKRKDDKKDRKTRR